MNTTTSRIGSKLDPQECKTRARDVYLRSVSDSTPLSGKALGAMFGRSERWGRRVIAEVRTTGDAERTAASAATPHPVGHEAETDQQDGQDRVSSPVALVDENGRSVPPLGRDNGTARTIAATHVDDDGPSGTSSDGTGPDLASPAMQDSHRRGRAGRAFEPGQPSGQTAHLAVTGRRLPRAGEVPWWVRTVTVLAVVAVALAAAAASFEHVHEVAVMAGEDGRAWLLPVSVDGLVITATMVLYAASKTRRPAGAIAWLALGLGLAASLAGNVIATSPDLVSLEVLRIIVAAWPPVALALALHILLYQTDTA